MKYKNTIEIRGNYKNGLKDSIQFKFNKKGHLVEKAIYKNGLKNGMFLTFGDSSKLVSEKIYKKDTLVKEWDITKATVLALTIQDQIGIIISPMDN